MVKAKKEETQESVPTPPVNAEVTPKQRLLNLYHELKSLGISRISDLESMIARAEG